MSDSRDTAADAATDRPAAAQAGAPVVDIRGLWTAFGKPPKQTVIHKDLDLRIDTGEIVALVGGSGTGKTVLLRQMLGLEKTFKGEVSVLGEPAAQLGRRGASSRVGMLFQHGALYSAFNVLDNIAFPLRELGTVPVSLARDVAMVKLQMVGLKPDDAVKMPADLSGGMVKRVALARALAMDPPLLLLDEPTAGLDPAGSDSFCDLLEDLHKTLGLTVVMVTHDLDTIFALATRVAVLAEQHVITSGPPREVAQFDHPFTREYFLGDRGRRAMAPLPPRPDGLRCRAAVAAPARPPRASGPKPPAKAAPPAAPTPAPAAS
jgi:phospholipid/cholesterol/gamma-HCH transport system ATP-binding protein